MTQLCRHRGCWHGEHCCVKADAWPWQHSALLVLLGGEDRVPLLGEGAGRGH